jgi:hypothetical protein
MHFSWRLLTLVSKNAIEQVVTSMSSLNEDLLKEDHSKEVFHAVYLEMQGEVVEIGGGCS